MHNIISIYSTHNGDDSPQKWWRSYRPFFVRSARSSTPVKQMEAW